MRFAIFALSAALAAPLSPSAPAAADDPLPPEFAEKVETRTLENDRGLKVVVSNYGATILSIETPDRDGKRANIALGFPKIEDYVTTAGNPYFGAVVGRYGNRIAGGKFDLGGETYELAVNNGPNHLHGGKKGFDKQIWTFGEPIELPGGAGAVRTHESPDGDEGYPGTLKVKVSYIVTASNELIVQYMATTDKATPVNLTQHTYFNLKGEGEGDILGHVLTLNADEYTPVDETMITTGETASVTGTPFDFRQPTPIGDRINADNEQLKRGGGYDHNYVVKRTAGTAADRLTRFAEVYEPTTGRTMTVSTTEPGVQLYTGNFLDGSLTGPSGKPYGKRSGFCLETQHYPDSPNQPEFPSSILEPGEELRSMTIFTFGVRPADAAGSDQGGN